MRLNTILRLSLLCFCLLAASTQLVRAGDAVVDHPPAAVQGKIGTLTWQKFQSGEVRELIVRFADPALDGRVSAHLAQRRLVREDAAALALRATGYRQLKGRNLSALAAGDAEVRRDFSHLPMSFLRLRDQAALLRLLARPEVAAVYEVRRVELLAANLDLIGQPQAAQVLGQTGAGATIAVLDTGVNYIASVFGSCTAPGVPAATCKVVAALDTGTTDNALDDNGHGSSVAAVALSAAPGVKIAAVDVCDPVYGCNNVDIIDGVNWAIANKAVYNIVAINISLGGGAPLAAPCAGVNSYGLETPVQNARNAGILTLGASGNNSAVNGILWPACTPGVISVGAVYDTDTTGCTPGLKDTVLCSTNVSSYLSLLTPAGATSTAAPLAAAAAAVLAAAYPAETPAAWANRMIASGKPVTDNRSGSPSGLGYVIPRLDMAAALLYPSTSPPANDAFAAATVLSGNSGAALGWNFFASQESGEPAHAGIGGGHSVWWQWTATTSGNVTLDSHGSNLDTLLAVYTGGSVGALTAVAANDNDGVSGGVSGLSFHADAGATYHFALDGKVAASGDLYLNRSFVADPATTANLSISLSDTPDPVSTGATLTYRFTVSNSGPAAASNVTVSQALPAGVNFVSADAGCTHGAGTVVCTLGSLSAGGQVGRNVLVSVNTAGVLTSQALVSTSTIDGNPLNDSATASTSVIDGGVAGGDGDVPLPAWALVMLGAGLLGGMQRANERR